jgi:hypothetical protein
MTRSPSSSTTATALVAALTVTLLAGCGAEPAAVDSHALSILGLSADERSAMLAAAAEDADQLTLEAAGPADGASSAGDTPDAAAPSSGGAPVIQLASSTRPLPRETGGDPLVSAIMTGIESLHEGLTTGFRKSSSAGEDVAFSTEGAHYAVTGGRAVGGSKMPVVLERSSSGNSSRVQFTVETDYDIQGCPSPYGTIRGRVSVSSRVDGAVTSGTLNGTVWGEYAITLDLVGHVGDDARLTSVDVEQSGVLTNGAQATDGGPTKNAGYNFESSWRYRIPYVDGFHREIEAKGRPVVKRASSTVSLAMQYRFLETQAVISQVIGADAMDAAADFWEYGGCVDMAIAAMSDIPTVERGSVTDVTITPTAKSDGLMTGGTVTAERASGDGTIDPDGAQAAPSTHHYRAPDAVDTTEIDFVARSKRGVGRLHQVFRTAEPGYVIDATVNGIHTTATKCGGLIGNWEIISESSEWPYAAVSTAEISSNLSGGYSLKGESEGFEFTGGGSAAIVKDGDHYVLQLRPQETGFEGNGDFVVTESLTVCAE